MAEQKPPMTFSPPAPRDPSTQFARMPESPESVLQGGGSPQKWQPGLGDGSAPMKRGDVPWPPAKAPPLPFKNLQQGRK